MDTLILHINKRHKACESFLEYLHSLPFVEVEYPETPYPNANTRKAIEDADSGKTNKYSGSVELFDRLEI
jgi:hypothetical protein